MNVRHADCVTVENVAERKPIAADAPIVATRSTRSSANVGRAKGVFF